MPAKKGTEHYRAVLTVPDILEIRRLAALPSCPHCGGGPLSYKAIGDKFRVSAVMVFKIVKRQNWKSVP